MPASLSKKTRHAAVLALGLVAGLAQAHDLSQDPLPASPGWRLGASVATAWADSSESAWPKPRWTGFPGSGQTPTDRRGFGLEHATLDAAFSVGDRYGLYLAGGQHGSDPVHTEAAKVEARWRSGLDTLAVQLGRDRVPMGGPLTGAGHFDRYAQGPLVKRVVLNDDWISDGLNLRWRRSVANGVQAVDLGLWRARTYPGGLEGPLAPALHLQGRWADLNADLFVAALRPKSRGITAASSAAGHSHNQPDCRLSLVATVCFEGRSELLGGSLSWDPHEALPLTVTLAALLQRERGTLYSARSNADDYRATTAGGWLDLMWMQGEQWSYGARLERVTARHQLTGPSASLVAQDAGLLPNRPLQRAAAVVNFMPADRWQLGLEAGRERGAATQQDWWALRLSWQAPDLLQGRW